MKALVLYGPGEYGYEDNWPMPEVKTGWARVKVAYAGVCGSDLPRFASTGSYHHPMILGHEFSGIIDEPAPKSKLFSGGEKVAVLPLIPCGECPGCEEAGPFHCNNYQFIGSRNDGGFAEYCLVPESNLYPLPDNFDLLKGAFIEPALVGLHAVKRSGLDEGRAALVTGSGTIGLMIAMWLRHFNASHVLITDIRDQSLSIAKNAGVNNTLNTLKDPIPADVRFDASYEASGAREALAACINAVKNLGTVTVVGRSNDDVVIPARLFESFMRKEQTVRGCWGYDIKEAREDLNKVLVKDRFPLEALVTQVVPIEESAELIKAMIRKEIFYCKAMIQVTGGNEV